jgi:hypothetical protein
VTDPDPTPTACAASRIVAAACADVDEQAGGCRRRRLPALGAQRAAYRGAEPVRRGEQPQRAVLGGSSTWVCLLAARR